MSYTFVTDCIHSTYEAISALKATETSISRRAFACSLGAQAWRELQASLGYDRSFPISRDWHIGYYRGVYEKRPAVFLRWSGIEYIYCRAS